MNAWPRGTAERAAASTAFRSAPEAACCAAASATNPTPIAADLELTIRTAGPNSRATDTAEL